MMMRARQRDWLFHPLMNITEETLLTRLQIQHLIFLLYPLILPLGLSFYETCETPLMILNVAFTALLAAWILRVAL
jgi:hypothetical protein